jgi:Fe-S cluster assembly protein SufD
MDNEIIVKKHQELLLPLLWTGEETKLSYNIMLAGEGAKITLLALLLGKDTDTIDLKINVFHQNQHTESKIIVKSALNDNASVNFDGLVKIEPGAKGTNAWLGAYILLLSDRSKGRAVPSLEILENDIKAGHATTVGRVNDLELFYLMSRGLSRQQAESLIVKGFFQSMLHDFPPDFQKRAEKELARYDTYGTV